MISLSYFKNTLPIAPLKQTSGSILLFNAKSLDMRQYKVADYLSPFELQVISRRKSPQAKQEYLATRLLLKYLLKSCFSEFAATPLTAISSQFDQASSKLQLHVNGRIINCCISHSHGFVGAALNPEQLPFGFDIEKISLQRPFAKLAKHFYHADEITLITTPTTALAQAQHFFRIWTLKEALAKATSRPIAKLLSPNVFSELTKAALVARSGNITAAAINNDIANAEQAQTADFDISVVMQQRAEWRCAVIDLAKLRRVIAFK
jgi:4'-phosphopantetheinyl transferase